MRYFLAILCCAMIAGCSPGSGGSAKTAKEKSSVQTALDGFTGKTAVNAGKKARADINRVSAQKDADLEAVLGD